MTDIIQTPAQGKTAVAEATSKKKFQDIGKYYNSYYSLFNISKALYAKVRIVYC